MAEDMDLPTRDEARLSKLGSTLRAAYSANDQARRPVEDQWLKNVRQYIGEYDPNILNGLSPNQSRAYPKITRVKVLSLVARLHALLFPAGENNWGIEASPVPSLPEQVLFDIQQKWMADNPNKQATQEELDRLVVLTAQDIALKMERVIDDQLKDSSLAGTCDYQALARKVIFSGALYGCGVLKGPMTIQEEGSTLTVDANGVPQVVTQPVYRPFFEFVPVWDYYPDLSAKEFKYMDGQFQRHVYSRAAFAELATRSDFMGDKIKTLLRENPNGNYTKKNYEQELDRLSSEQDQNQPGEKNKFELLEFWGNVSGHDLQSAGVDVPDSDLDKNMTACVWLFNNTVIKAAKVPYEPGVSMYHQFVFEDDEVNLLGSGLPAIMRDSQLGISTFTRMLVDNSAAVCGPNVEVDLEQLSGSTNPTTFAPFKVWLKDSPSTNGQRAVQSISFDSHISELLQAIRLMREFADSETFVNQMTGGDMENVPSEALRTQGNMSMAMAAAALPFKDIVRNYDQFTASVIHSLTKWNLTYNIRRDELAGDVRPIAKGANSLMAKEVRASTMDQLAATLSPEERLYINEEELLKERLMARDLPLDKLMAPKEEVERRKAAAAEQAQRNQQQRDAMFQAELQTMRTEALKDTAQAQKNLDMADVAVAKMLLEAVERGANTDELIRIARSADRNGQAQNQSGRPDQGGASGVPGAGAGQGQM